MTTLLVGTSKGIVVGQGATGTCGLAPGAPPVPSGPPVPPAPTPPPTPPPSSTNLTYVITPLVPLPGYLTPVTDLPWGTTITRVSNVNLRRQAYARFAAWNCDGSKALLGFQFPGRMIDGNTYADLGSFGQISNAIWSTVNRNVIYGVAGAKLVRQDATTASISSGSGGTVHDFAAQGYTSISIGGDDTGATFEGGVSDGDQVICVTAYGAGAAHLISYDLVGGSIINDITAPSGINNAQASRRGNYVVVVGGFGTRIYPADLSSFITVEDGGNHGDNVLDADGVTELYVANNAVTGGVGRGVIAYRLSDGHGTTLLGPGTAFEYGHTSGRNFSRNGWVYLSNYDTVATAGRAGHDQLVAVKTDGSGTVNVFGFAHHSSDPDYAAQPHMVPSNDGLRVMFASDWGSTTGPVYAYVAALLP